MFDFFKSNIDNIEPKKAKENLDEHSEIVLLDVRTESEYKEMRIKNSINIPLDKMKEIETKNIEKKNTIYVYCLSGMRSRSACKMLKSMGYEKVFNLGGINDWPYEKETGMINK